MKQKMKPPEEPAPPKRKRARGPAAAGEDAAPKFSDEDLFRNYRRSIEKDMPRILAATARELGFAAARPRDFFCGCTPHGRTGLPVCLEKKPQCPFAGRVRPEEIDLHDDPRTHGAYMARIMRLTDERKKATASWRGKPLRPAGAAG